MVPEFSPTQMECFLWNKKGLVLVIRAIEELVLDEVLFLSTLKDGRKLIAKGDRFDMDIEVGYQKFIRE